MELHQEWFGPLSLRQIKHLANIFQPEGLELGSWVNIKQKFPDFQKYQAQIPCKLLFSTFEIETTFIIGPKYGRISLTFDIQV